MTIATQMIAVMGAVGSRAMTIDEITDVLPIARNSISAAACRLVSRGYLERIEAGSYRLTLTGREALAEGQQIKSGPYRGQRKQRLCRDSLRQRAWRAMCLQGNKPFTIGYITQLAVRDEAKGEANIRRYMHLLARAGYVAEAVSRADGTSLTSPGFKVWRLVRSSGDVAPVVQNNGASLLDPNTGEVHPCA